MNESPPPAQGFVVWAAIFEGGLAVVAVVVGRWVGHPPLETLQWSWLAFGLGLAATLPLLGLLALSLLLPWRPMRELTELVQRQLVPLLAEVSPAELAVLCLLAGLGEETFFRGLIQGGLATWLGGADGKWIALATASLLFAAVHPMSRTYFILAGVIGLYLGGVWLLTGNLLAPIVIHALYDYVAILWYLRRARRESAEA